MTAIVETTNNQTTAVAAVAQKGSLTIEAVSASTNELSTSVSEIGKQASLSATISASAVEEADRTNVTINGLSVSETSLPSLRA
ncbi:hypothetical protein JQ604_26455 [Bradyrhizobium jicamae]|uniref:hypothetical protein n=1 Tax=Bradyrhizobium jicamae TaxID=280332 RepID=UPI001BAC30D7|nr:hypothetical protein [Bradyrhizobium jicamae]MBR0755731.1 hypothetical protein [Bradyrhizobium jicamae]